MILSRTPYRMSFFGGGTDYPSWYLAEGGAVLSTTIDKYCYIMCRYMPPWFGVRHRIVWSHIESVTHTSEILHPVVREGIRYLGFEGDPQGLEIHHQGDLPARSGIGSSSAFSVGLINALTSLHGSSLGKHELALEAIHLEQNVLQEAVGSQDQVAAAYGGFNKITFGTDGHIVVDPVRIDPEKLDLLQSHLMLCYTGSTRLAGDIASQVTANLPQRREAVKRMHAMVDEGVAAIQSGNVEDFADLLNDAWRLKRSLAEGVSTPEVDRIYDAALSNGALGGKLLGAGGSGFLLLIVPPDRQAALRESLPHLIWVPVGFETEGSTLIYKDQSTAKSPAASVSPEGG